MSSELEILRELYATPELLTTLDSLSGGELAIQKQLRSRYSPELVRAALQIAELRQRAAGKFRLAEQMWLRRTGLEQATSEAVANHKAQRFSGPVYDLCAGLGGDAIALATRGPTTAVDRDPVSLQCLEWNAIVYSVRQQLTLQCGDVMQMLPEISSEKALVHIDPDRRSVTGKRSLRIEDGSPDLDQLYRVMEQTVGGAMKLSPAANFMGKFANADLELVSWNGECKEATVWYGSLASGNSYAATVLPQGLTVTGDPLNAISDLDDVRAYLYDPDPAVVRAGLVDVLAEKLNLSRLDSAEEYLTADRVVISPFVRGYRVIDNLSNNEKVIKKAIRRIKPRTIEIKCRHLSIDAQKLLKQFSRGEQQGVSLVFARVLGKARALICQRTLPEEYGTGEIA